MIKCPQIRTSETYFGGNHGWTTKIVTTLQCTKVYYDHATYDDHDFALLKVVVYMTTPEGKIIRSTHEYDVEAINE